MLYVIVPVYKKDPNWKPSIYSPISLICNALKLMEHIIVSNSMSFYDKHEIFSKFRSKHSLETQFISFTQEVHDNLEQSQQTDTIVKDFSKSFNKVDLSP
jgi:hypothetical protein